MQMKDVQRKYQNLIIKETKIREDTVKTNKDDFRHFFMLMKKTFSMLETDRKIRGKQNESNLPKIGLKYLWQ